MRREWKQLADGGSSPGLFDVGMLAGLPEPARLWLPHSIAPGTPLWQSVEVGGVTIPCVVRAGWWWGTDRQAEGEFFRAEITGATHPGRRPAPRRSDLELS